MRLLTCVIICAVLAADEVVLDDGTVLDGTIVSETPSDIAIQVGDNGMSATRHLARTRITRLTYGPSARTQALATLDAEVAALGQDASADAWAALAVRARTLGERPRARRWAYHALERDRSQASARALVNHRLVNGVWMNAHEAAKAAGLMWYEGTWLTHDGVLAARAEAAQRVAAARIHGEALAVARAAQRDPTEDTPWPTTTGVTSSVVYGYTWWPRQPAYLYQQSTTQTNTSGGTIRAAGQGSHSAWSVSWSW